MAEQDTGRAIILRLDKAETERHRERIERIFVAVVLLLVGGFMVTTQVAGVAQRNAIRRTVQEIRDCTTPDVPSDCQRRIAASQAQRNVISGLKADNLNASIAVGTCLRSGAPDVAACSRALFAELNRKP